MPRVIRPSQGPIMAYLEGITSNGAPQLIRNKTPMKKGDTLTVQSVTYKNGMTIVCVVDKAGNKFFGIDPVDKSEAVKDAVAEAPDAIFVPKEDSKTIRDGISAPAPNMPPWEIGVDIAKEGKDKTVYRTQFMGIPIILDPKMPPGEIRFSPYSHPEIKLVDYKKDHEQEKKN